MYHQHWRKPCGGIKMHRKRISYYNG
jgi:hypothetical protein